jgi:hypothetical protein
MRGLLKNMTGKTKAIWLAVALAMLAAWTLGWIFFERNFNPISPTPLPVQPPMPSRPLPPDGGNAAPALPGPAPSDPDGPAGTAGAHPKQF